MTMYTMQLHLSNSYYNPILFFFFQIWESKKKKEEKLVNIQEPIVQEASTLVLNLLHQILHFEA